MKFLIACLFSLALVGNALADQTMYQTNTGLRYTSEIQVRGNTYATYLTRIGVDDVVITMFGYGRTDYTSPNYLIVTSDLDPIVDADFFQAIDQEYSGFPILFVTSDEIFDLTNIKTKRGTVETCTRYFSNVSGTQSFDTHCVGDVDVKPYYQGESFHEGIQLAEYEGEEVQFWYLEREDNVRCDFLLRLRHRRGCSYKPTWIIPKVILLDSGEEIALYFDELQ